MILLQLLGIVFLIIGGVFGLLGSYGMIKLTGPMQRLHAPSKASTVGVAAVLIGAFFIGAAGGSIGWHNLLITLFLLITAPVSALFLSKAHLFATVDRSTLPATGTAADWATLADPETD
ncbi:MAG: monovalent cation/H(+) antiporter subunit G [Pseudomonadota bacterium]